MLINATLKLLLSTAVLVCAAVMIGTWKLIRFLNRYPRWMVVYVREYKFSGKRNFNKHIERIDNGTN